MCGPRPAYVPWSGVGVAQWVAAAAFSGIASIWAARVAQYRNAALRLWGSRGGSPRRPLWVARVAQYCNAALLHGCSAPTRMRARLLSSLMCAWHSERGLPGQMHAAVSGARLVASRRAHGRRGTCLYVCTPPDVDSSRRPKAGTAGHLSGNPQGPSGGVQRPAHRAMVGAAISSVSRARSAAWRRHARWRANRLSLPEDGAKKARLEECSVGHCGSIWLEELLLTNSSCRAEVGVHSRRVVIPDRGHVTANRLSS